MKVPNGLPRLDVAARRMLYRHVCGSASCFGYWSLKQNGRRGARLRYQNEAQEIHRENKNRMLHENNVRMGILLRMMISIPIASATLKQPNGARRAHHLRRSWKAVEGQREGQRGSEKLRGRSFDARGEDRLDGDLLSMHDSKRQHQHGCVLENQVIFLRA